MARSVDEIDRGIIALLQQDGRTSNVAIARVLGIAEATVRKRVERLLEEGMIRVIAVAEPAAFGLGTPIQIGIQADLSRIEEVARCLAEMPEVHSVSVVTGVYDVIVECVLPSPEQLLSFLVDRISPIPGVKRTETSHVMKIVKRSCDWSPPEEQRRRSDPDRIAAPGDRPVLPGSIIIPS